MKLSNCIRKTMLYIRCKLLSVYWSVYDRKKKWKQTPWTCVQRSWFALKSNSYERLFMRMPQIRNSQAVWIKYKWISNIASLVLVHFQIQFLHRYINSRIMAVTTNPNPEKLRENVILQFRNLKVTWKLVSMHCFDLFWQDKIYFQVLTAEKRCMFWSGLRKR